MVSNAAPGAGPYAAINGTYSTGTGQNPDASSITTDSHSFRYESIEKAKKVLADDRRSRFEAARASRLRENEIQRQQLLASEQQAREQSRISRESMDEHAARLMEEMKTNVIKRFESDLYTTVRTNVIREFDANTKAGLKKALRNEVYDELYSELKPIVEAELADKLCETVRRQLEEELKPIVEAQIEENNRKEQALNQPEMHSIAANSADGAGHLNAKDKYQENMTGLEFGQNGDTKQSAHPEFDHEEMPLYPDLSHFPNGIEEPYSENDGGGTNDVLDALSIQQQNETSISVNKAEESNVNLNSNNEPTTSATKLSPKRSFEGDEDSLQAPNKRPRTGVDLSFGQDHFDPEEAAQFIEASQQVNPESLTLIPKIETPPATRDADAYNGAFEDENDGRNDLDDRNADVNDDEHINNEDEGKEMHSNGEGQKSKGKSEEQLEDQSGEEHEQELDEEEEEEFNEVDDDEIDAEGEEEEEDEEEEEQQLEEEEEEGEEEDDDEDEDEEVGEGDDDEDEQMQNTPKTVIAVSNTQDTAFVIEDSDGDEEDADKTLVAEAMETKVEQGKIIFDKDADEEEEEEEDEEDEEGEEEVEEEVEGVVFREEMEEEEDAEAEEEEEEAADLVAVEPAMKVAQPALEV